MKKKIKPFMGAEHNRSTWHGKQDSTRAVVGLLSQGVVPYGGGGCFAFVLTGSQGNPTNRRVPGASWDARGVERSYMGAANRYAVRGGNDELRPA